MANERPEDVTGGATACAIGWDVRGWQSADQSVAVAASIDGRVRWLGFAAAFRFGVGEPLGLASLVGRVEPDLRTALTKAARVVVAIDAPLAFPRAFAGLVGGLRPDGEIQRPVPAEIDNPLAYRDCDRWIRRTHGKKPLSAAFDRLGNPATLAMSLAHGLSSDGFVSVPQEAPDAARAVIEVYPGIHKIGLKRTDAALAPLARWLPRGIAAGTDIYDASICALLGLRFATGGDCAGLPALVGPPSTARTDEGWIYGLPAEYLSAHRRAGPPDV